MEKYQNLENLKQVLLQQNQEKFIDNKCYTIQLCLACEAQQLSVFKTNNSANIIDPNSDLIKASTNKPLYTNLCKCKPRGKENNRALLNDLMTEHLIFQLDQNQKKIFKIYTKGDVESSMFIYRTHYKDISNMLMLPAPKNQQKQNQKQKEIVCQFNQFDFCGIVLKGNIAETKVQIYFIANYDIDMKDLDYIQIDENSEQQVQKQFNFNQKLLNLNTSNIQLRIPMQFLRFNQEKQSNDVDQKIIESFLKDNKIEALTFQQLINKTAEKNKIYCMGYDFYLLGLQPMLKQVNYDGSKIPSNLTNWLKQIDQEDDINPGYLYIDSVSFQVKNDFNFILKVCQSPVSFQIIGDEAKQEPVIINSSKQPYCWSYVMTRLFWNYAELLERYPYLLVLIDEQLEPNLIFVIQNLKKPYYKILNESSSYFLKTYNQYYAQDQLTEVAGLDENEGREMIEYQDIAFNNFFYKNEGIMVNSSDQAQQEGYNSIFKYNFLMDSQKTFISGSSRQSSSQTIFNYCGLDKEQLIKDFAKSDISDLCKYFKDQADKKQVKNCQLIQYAVNKPNTQSPYTLIYEKIEQNGSIIQKIDKSSNSNASSLLRNPNFQVYSSKYKEFDIVCINSLNSLSFLIDDKKYTLNFFGTYASNGTLLKLPIQLVSNASLYRQQQKSNDLQWENQQRSESKQLNNINILELTRTSACKLILNTVNYQIQKQKLLNRHANKNYRFSNLKFLYTQLNQMAEISNLTYEKN